ncbi:MAG TPA: hypothetical protein VHF25_05545 [Nitriliruptorales bacterium]|nr:hypothetical protein [Nitriliruptorales bacterium]
MSGSRPSEAILRASLHSNSWKRSAQDGCRRSDIASQGMSMGQARLRGSGGPQVEDIQREEQADGGDAVGRVAPSGLTVPAEVGLCHRLVDRDAISDEDQDGGGDGAGVERSSRHHPRL